MTKLHAKAIARRLREEGHSYTYIVKNVRVSKSTLGIWLADIPFTPNAVTIERIGKARAASGAAKNKLKRESITQAAIEAKRQLGAVSQRDLFMLGLGVYIGEGAKTSSSVCVVNADHRIIRLAINWFVSIFGVDKKNFRVRLHLYPDCNEQESRSFWSQRIGIPEGQFLKSIFDRRLDKKAIKSGKLPHGTADLRINANGDKRFGVFLKRKVDALMDSVL